MPWSALDVLGGEHGGVEDQAALDVHIGESLRAYKL